MMKCSVDNSFFHIWRCGMKTICLCLICVILIDGVYCLCNYEENKCLKELIDPRNHKDRICRVSCEKLPNETCELFPPNLKHEKFDELQAMLQAVPVKATKSVYLNFTVINPEWTRLRIKLYRQEPPWIYRCAEYTQDLEKEQKPFSLEINLPQPYSVFEGKQLHIDYDLTENHVVHIGRLVFNVPSYWRFVGFPVHQREIFSYVDRAHPLLLLLTIQPLEKRLNVTGYKVALFVLYNGNIRKIKLKPPQRHPTMDNLILYLPIRHRIRSFYYFIITSDLKECDSHFCYETVTPATLIQGPDDTLEVLVIAIGLVLSFTPTYCFLFSLFKDFLAEIAFEEEELRRKAGNNVFIDPDIF